jgi:chaperonin cofactor prefoldin
MANIKFFRKDVAPSNPQEGYIWFNSSNNTIQLYKNSAWEVYTGKINNVTYSDGKLTIVPHVGDSTTIDLSTVANISDLSTRLGTLETSFNTLSGEFETEKGKISTLQGEMSTVKAATATMIGQLAGIEDTVVAHVTAEFEKHNTERETIDEGFESRISTLETGHTTLDGKIDGVQSTLQGAINTEKGRIDALVGSDSGSIRDIAVDVLTETLVSETASEAFDTLQEVSAWIKNHPENAATMNSNISTNTTNIATNTADITTIKGNIETINTTIEENELTVASALTDLDARINSLASGTVSSVSGENYVEVTTTDGAVVVKATTGAVANGDNALALASDVKSYVDNA